MPTASPFSSKCDSENDMGSVLHEGIITGTNKLRKYFMYDIYTLIQKKHKTNQSRCPGESADNVNENWFSFR